MWKPVRYKQELNLGDKIRVRRTNHEAVISNIVGKPDIIHCKTYHIEPKDPNDLGGHWFFSYAFDIWIE